MAKQPLVTLLTDFGASDPYVAAMKGVILSQCPRARLVDISHQVPPHDILAGAMVLAEAAPYFPPETVHVVVVDPGVGTDRRILAGKFGGQRFLFPDNGVISVVAETMPLEDLVVVRNTDFFQPGGPSRTFQGRDVFAPLAAQLLNGLDVRRLGPQPDTYKLLELPVPRQGDDGIIGEIMYVDHFGNLISNITRRDVESLWDDPAVVRVDCNGRRIGPLHGTYGFVEAGGLLALFNSMNRLEVAVNQGRACDVLGATKGAEVRVVSR